VLLRHRRARIAPRLALRLRAKLRAARAHWEELRLRQWKQKKPA
jgi:hypothetical protein